MFDVVAMLRISVWQGGHFVRAAGYEFEDAQILRATEDLVGGSWAVPDDIIRLNTEAEARKAALRAAWREKCRGLVGVNLCDA